MGELYDAQSGKPVVVLGPPSEEDRVPVQYPETGKLAVLHVKQISVTPPKQ